MSPLLLAVLSIECFSFQRGTGTSDTYTQHSTSRLSSYACLCHTIRTNIHPFFDPHSLPELPRLATQRAFLLDILLGLQPPHDALHVEGVAARAPQRRTVVARVFDIRWACLKRSSANATHVLVNFPFPDGNCVPSFDLHFHIVRDKSTQFDVKTSSRVQNFEFS